MFYRFVITIVALFVLQVVEANDAELPVLRVLNWSEYIAVDESMDPESPIEDRAFCLSEFSKKFGCQIEYYEYEETIEAYSRIRKNVGFYDVVIASMGEINRMQKGGALDRLDKTKILNYRYVSLFYDSNKADEEVWNFAMPYLYGTTGIAYRSDLVANPVISWKQLFDPDELLRGKISVMNDSQVMFGIASVYKGKDPNSLKPSDYRKLTQEFRKLKEGGYLYDVSSNVEELSTCLLNGELAMAVMYSGDALAVSSVNPNVKYVVPEEGSEIYVDSLAVLDDSSQKELAYKFVNFMLDPEVNARNSIELLFPTMNLAALSVVERERPDLLSNADIYPLPDTLLSLKEFNAYSVVQEQYWNRFINED